MPVSKPQTARVRIPATSANLGPGFDSMGLALALYNYADITVHPPGYEPMLTVTQKPRDPGHETLSWYREPVTGAPADEKHLIYKAILYFYNILREPPPAVTIAQEDYIPMERGLGSSAACIVAGLLAANKLSGAGWTAAQLIDLAARIEGHPDNTTPALTGGLTVGVMTERGLVYSPVRGPWQNELRFALFIPAYKLATKKARAVLPPRYTRADLVFNASRTALLVSALITGDYDKLAAALADRAHQPYRQDLVPGMAEIIREAPACGAYGVVLSGAGPALLAVTTDESFVARIQPFADQLPHRWDLGWVTPDLHGATVE